MKHREPWTSLEKRKARNSVEVANMLTGTEFEIAWVNGVAFLIEDGHRFATVGNFSELDALLAGISCGERRGEPKSCYSFSHQEWQAFQKGRHFGQNLRRR